MPAQSAFDFAPIEAMTFDCYGTLIDWEAGILAGLRQVVGGQPGDDQLLEAYARAEAELEAGPYEPYRQVLGDALGIVATAFGVEATATRKADFGDSVGHWPAFPDSATALAALRRHYRLGVITNCDDDLFAWSDQQLGGPFEWVITAQQVGSYKPDRRNFLVALERIGLPASSILHVAQSLYHDHVPARELGLATAWIDRRHGRTGAGATPQASAEPDLAAPDMATFAAMALG